MKQTLQRIIGTLMGVAVLFSCSSEDMDGIDDVSPSSLTDFIVSSKEQSVKFDIKYEVPNGYKVVFDVYAENPYEISSEGLSKKGDLKPIISGMTDDKGCYNVTRVISDGVKEVYVTSDVAGVPILLHGAIQGNCVTPVEMDLSTLVEEDAQAESRAAWNAKFLGKWNYWGKPNYIDTSIQCPIDKKDLKAISAALPEWKSANTAYTDENFIYVKEEAEVWISLLSEKSLFNNVLGYYCYTEGQSKENIEEIVALPRANIALLNNSGLKYGEYVKLKYYNPETKALEDKFPAGSHIGWVLHRSGYHCLTSAVTQGIYQFYSNEAWNPEKKDKDHTAIFKTNDGNIIVGMEDLYNETLLSDKDCNDIIFHVASSPESALMVNTEIPEAPENDYVEEVVDVIQPLSLIIDIPENDELIKDLYVASKSKLEVVDGKVTGVEDVMYIANSKTMNELSSTSYTSDEKTRKVVVRTTIKLARSAEKEEKKGRTVVRTTIKNTDWDADIARAISVFGDYESLEQWILAEIERHREDLTAGEVLKLEVRMEFEGVEYEEFVNSIDVPPYSPFIKDIEE